MSYYVAIALRHGLMNDEWYVAGISSDLVALRSTAEKLVELRGGKYGVGIFNDSNELVDYVSAHESTPLPIHSGLRVRAQAVGSRVLTAFESPHENQPLPEWLKELCVRDSASYEDEEIQLRPGVAHFEVYEQALYEGAEPPDPTGGWQPICSYGTVEHNGLRDSLGGGFEHRGVIVWVRKTVSVSGSDK